MVIARMICGFPAVKAQLREYKNFLTARPGPLTQQGLDSIRDKTFHCLGGSVYAVMAPRRQRQNILKFIIAFQTISDYLDNLCDRLGVFSEQGFRQLHTAMLDSLEPDSKEYEDYYALFPCKEDGGYLQKLVGDCRRALGRIPTFILSKKRVLELTKLYIDLQSFKHMEVRRGEEKLAALHARYQHRYPGLHWWEFAAACGSTLGIFTIIASPVNSEQLWQAYMPWVNGLHILLDYYIDQEEDIQHGDLNFVSYHQGKEQQVRRLLWFYGKSQRAIRGLEKNRFHGLVIDGLFAIYLSDAKARSPQLATTSLRLLHSSGLRVRVLERMARALRRQGVI